MKISKLFALLLIVTLFASCKDDDKDPAELILGTWSVTAFSGNGSYDYVSPSYNTSSVFSFVGSNFNATMTFNEDGTFTNTGTFVQSVTYTEDGVTNTETDDNADLFDDGTYTIVDNQMIIVDEDGFINTFEIEKISGSSLKLTLDDSDVDEDGDTITTTVRMFDMSLSK